MSYEQRLERKSPDGVPYWVAIHEASHAIAHWQITTELNLWVPGFFEVVVRTPTEVATSPYVDHKGRENYGQAGVVDGPSLYNATGIKGVMLTNRTALPQAEFNENLKSLRMLAEAEVVTRLAGPAGELHYLQEEEWAFWDDLVQNGESDWRGASRCALDFSASDADFWKFINKARKKATRIVRRHWPSVVALADTLMVQHSLSADEALPIMKAASLPS